MIQSSTKEIDGYKYEVTQFPATEALKIKTALIKVFGDSIGQLIGGVVDTDKKKKSLLDVDITGAALGNAIKSLTLRLDEDQVQSLVFRMLAATSIKHNEEGGRFGDSSGKTLFDNHFAGRLQTLYRLLFYIVEVNYADFLSGLNIGKLTPNLTSPKDN